MRDALFTSLGKQPNFSDKFKYFQNINNKESNTTAQRSRNDSIVTGLK